MLSTLDERQKIALERLADSHPDAKVVGATELVGDPIIRFPNGDMACVHGNGYIERRSGNELTRVLNLVESDDNRRRVLNAR